MTTPSQNDETRQPQRRLVEEVRALRSQVAELRRTRNEPGDMLNIYRSFVEDSAYGLGVLQDDRIVYANRAWADMVGCSIDNAADVPPEDAWSFVHPEDQQMVRERYDHEPSEEVSGDPFEFRILRRDGRVAWVESRARRIEYQGRPASQISLVDVLGRARNRVPAQDSTEQFRLFYESSPFGYQSLDPDGCLLEVNSSWLEMLGYERDEVIGRWFGDFLTPAMRREFPDRFSRFKEAGHVTTAQWEMVCKDGLVRTVELDGRAVFDANGHYSHSHCVLRDVTAQMKALQTLHCSEQIHRALIQGLPDIVMRFDRDGRHLFVSDNVADIVDIPASGFLGKTHRELGFTEEMCELWEEAIKRIYDRGDPHETEFSFEGKRGEVIFNWRLVPEKDPDGRVCSVLSFSRDVTAQRRTEQALIASERRFRETLEQVQLVAVEIDADGHVVFANDFLLELTGRTRAAVLGKDWFELFIPEAQQDLLREVHADNLRDGKQFVQHENPILTATGEFRTIRWTNTVHRDVNGVSIGVVSLGEDLTERQRAQERLRQSEEQYRFLFDHMLSGVALHEIVVDESGAPVDYRFLSVNNAFETMTGLKASEIRGRTVKDVLPGIEPVWIERYGCVAITGEPTQFEQYSENLGRYFEVRAYCPRPMQFATVFHDVTERHEAAKELLANQEKLASIFDGAPVMMIVVDEDRRVRNANRAALEATGHSAKDIQGLRGGEAMRCLHSLDDPGGCGFGPVCSQCSIRQIVNETLETGRNCSEINASIPIISGDGSTERIFEVSTARVDSHGNALVLVCLQDITERKQADEAVRQSEDKYRKLFSEMSTGCALHEVIVDSNGTPVDYVTLEVNGMYETILGAGSKDIVGRRASEILPPDELRTWLDLFGPVALMGQSCHYQIYSKTNRRWFEGNAFCPEPGRFAVTFSDVTRRKEAEEALERHRAELQAIYDHAPVMMCVLDADRRVLYANRAFQDFSGLSQRELQDGRACGVFGCINALDDPKGCGFGSQCRTCPLREALDDTMNTGGSHLNIEYRATLEQNGRTRDVVLLGATAAVGNSEETNVLLCLQNVTEARQMEEKARDRQATLLHASRLTTLGEMASGLAHELNQPLSAILNYGTACIQFASADRPDIERISRNLQSIIGQAERAGEIMSRIRAFAQRRQPRTNSVDLNEIVTSVASFLSWEIQQKGVAVHMDLADSLPPVWADSIQMEQVLVNLIRNAIEAMDQADGPAKNMTIRTRNDDTGVIRMEVSDTGVGVPVDQMERIFDAFFSTKPEGLGVGLSISRTIVETYDGVLEARRNSGPGSTFIVTFPTGRTGNSRNRQ